jgi:hypothetical protein
MMATGTRGQRLNRLDDKTSASYVAQNQQIYVFGNIAATAPRHIEEVFEMKTAAAGFAIRLDVLRDDAVEKGSRFVRSAVARHG